MNSAPLIWAKKYLFNAKLEHGALTGKNVNVLLVEKDHTSFPFIYNLIGLYNPSVFSASIGKHANKIASLLADNRSFNKEIDIPIGISPNINLFHTDFNAVYPDKFSNILQKGLNHGYRIHISAHPYSVSLTRKIYQENAENFYKIAGDTQLNHLMITSPGHDGDKNVRFPGCLSCVLTVGVHDSNRNIASYCGQDQLLAKPDLLVADLPFLARLDDHSEESMRGTSAAVAIVAGLAALWQEKLTLWGYEYSPLLLRAVLLATGIPIYKPNVCIVNAESLFTDKSFLFIQSIDMTAFTEFTTKVCAITNGCIQFALVIANDCQNQEHYDIPKASIIFQSNSISKEFVFFGSTTFSCSVNVKEVFNINICSEHSSFYGYLVVTNVKQIEKRENIIMSAKKPVNNLPTILGISASHDASACIIRNGELRSAIQLERITRKKRDGATFLSTDQAALYCLNALSLKQQDVDYFAFNNQPLIPQYCGLSNPVQDAGFELFNPFADNAYYVSHHLAHAFSAFFASPFSEALVLVADGSGGSTIGEDDLILNGTQLKEYLKQPITSRPPLQVLSCYLFTNNKVELIYREYCDSFNVRCGSASLGETYASVSQYIFGEWQDGGKLMGLAPYGDANRFGCSLLQEDDNKQLNFNATWKQSYNHVLKRLPAMENKDLAARIQSDFETALLQRVKKIRSLTTIDNFCYAGGLALNSVANEKIFKHSGFKNFYIFPASNDAGISVGCAAAVNYKLSSSLQHQSLRHVYLGKPYQKPDYLQAIQAFFDYIHYETVDMNRVAHELANGKIIGLFEGGSEFGPRALGHRSILADPSKKSTWLYINKRIKYREDFRPFAPAVPEEEAATYFNIEGESPYMLRVVTVKEQYHDLLQAVTHVNGSARVQTVNQTTTPRLYDILVHFGQQKGIPVLINTSLNVRGQPIIETPEQAIEMLLYTHLDAILFENILVTIKKPAPEKLPASAQLLFAPDISVQTIINASGTEHYLTSPYREKTKLKIKQWQCNLLMSINQKREIIEFVNQNEEQFNVGIDEQLKWLHSLCVLKYLYIFNL